MQQGPVWWSPGDGAAAAIGGLVAVLGVYPWRTWRATRVVVTMAHEAGHAVVAVLTGRRLRAIHLHADASGRMWSAGRVRGPARILTTAAGYPAPSVLGLATTALVATGHHRVVLVVLVVLLLAMLCFVRNLYGMVALVIAVAAVALVGWWGDRGWQLVFCHALGWLLLLGGLRQAWSLVRTHRRAAGLDTHQLAELTGLPAFAWSVLFLLFAAGALAAGLWPVFDSPTILGELRPR